LLPQSPLTQRKSHLPKSDINGDDLISQTEYLAASKKAKTPSGNKKRTKIFARLDTNGDGQLSEEEYAARKKKGKKKLVERPSFFASVPQYFSGDASERMV
jgi:hypothetical protein